jgi:hypothetical protein
MYVARLITNHKNISVVQLIDWYQTEKTPPTTFLDSLQQH